MSVRRERPVRAEGAVDLYILTWAAGVLDALSYMRASVFTANMTGNAVILGLAVVGPERPKLFNSLLAIGSFTVGALIGGLVLVRWKRTIWSRDLALGLGLELPFAIAFTVLWAIFPVRGPLWAIPAQLATAACALGIQSAAVRHLKVSGVATTFITGTLTTAVFSYLERAEPGSAPPAKKKTDPLLLAGIFVLYILAALTGGAMAVAGIRLAPLLALGALFIVLVRSLKSVAAAR